MGEIWNVETVQRESIKNKETFAVRSDSALEEARDPGEAGSEALVGQEQQRERVRRELEEFLAAEPKLVGLFLAGGGGIRIARKSGGGWGWMGRGPERAPEAGAEVFEVTETEAEPSLVGTDASEGLMPPGIAAMRRRGRKKVKAPSEHYGFKP